MLRRKMRYAYAKRTCKIMVPLSVFDAKALCGAEAGPQTSVMSGSAHKRACHRRRIELRASPVAPARALLRPAALLLAASLVAVPAAAEPPPAIEPPPPDLARIYFYRQAQPLMLALVPDVVVNGKVVGDLSLGEVFFRDARPGRYHVFIEGDPSTVVELSLAPGEIGFVRCTLRIGLGTTRLSAETVAAAEATREIGGLGQEAGGPQPRENLP